MPNIEYRDASKWLAKADELRERGSVTREDKPKARQVGFRAGEDWHHMMLDRMDPNLRNVLGDPEVRRKRLEEGAD
jgi:hypothetical protein